MPVVLYFCSRSHKGDMFEIHYDCCISVWLKSHRFWNHTLSCDFTLFHTEITLFHVVVMTSYLNDCRSWSKIHVWGTSSTVAAADNNNIGFEDYRYCISNIPKPFTPKESHWLWSNDSENHSFQFWWIMITVLLDQASNWMSRLCELFLLASLIGRFQWHI